MTCLALGLAAAAQAQGVRVRGRAWRVTATDSTPLVGAWAVLHAVSALGGGPVDSQRTDPAGRFTVRAPRGDSLGRLLVSVSYAGIMYVSEPVAAGSDTVGTILVYDTSSVVPAVALVERHVVVQAAEWGGARRIIELWVLENAGRLTRVWAPTAPPVVELALPEDAREFTLGAGDVSEDAVFQRGDRALVTAPMPPGRRQLLVSYLVPAARTLVLPVDQPLARLNLLLADTSAAVSDPPALAFRGYERLQDTWYARYAGDGVPAGGAVRLTFAAAGMPAGDKLPWIVLALAALAVIGTVGWRVYAMRLRAARRPDSVRSQ